MATYFSGLIGKNFYTINRQLESNALAAAPVFPALLF